jgi:hypothetical protein
MALNPVAHRRSRFDPLVVGLPLAAVVVAAWDPARNGGPALCPFRGVTGIPCPGCGLTRAAGALMRGRVDDALHAHPLIVLLVVQLGVVWALLTFGRDRLHRLPRWVTPAALILNGAIFVAVWGVRLATGSLDA